jgi:hypothetical protein
MIYPWPCENYRGGWFLWEGEGWREEKGRLVA